MRSVLISAMLLTLALPMAAAQAEGEHYLNDAIGDTELDTFGVGPAVPVNHEETKAADLVGLDIIETDDDLTFNIVVAGLKEGLSQPVSYTIAWTWKQTEFTLRCARSEFSALGPGSQFCRLNVYDEDEGFGDASFVTPKWDFAAATISILVPKAYIVDLEGRSPTKGDVFKDLFVSSIEQVTSFGFATRIVDRMPDDGEERYELAIGDAYSGHIRLTTNDRVRVSNGGATTFVFQANLSNLGEIDENIRLDVADLPANWKIDYPTPIRVAGNGNVLFSLLVSVPFGHDHGGYSAFNVTATSGRDPSAFATMRMGVLHTPIPQPTGHHSKLWLHAPPDGTFFDAFVPASSASYINTVEEHTNDLPEAAATGSDGDGTYWLLPLDPGLGMGLDFDLEALGSITGKVFTRSTGDAQMSAEVYLVEATEEQDAFRSRFSYDLGDGVLLAESDEVTIAQQPSGATDFTLTLTPTEDSDYIAYAPKRNLVLRLELSGGENGPRTFCCIGGLTPSLDVASFVLELPLEEYHDKLTGINEVATALDLRAEGAVEKVGRPGTVMTYVFTLVNPGEQDIAMDIDIAGNHADLGQVVPGGLITLYAKSEQKITLAVTIPKEAAEGEEIEVLVFAHAREDPSKMAIGRTKTTVQLGAEAMPDERIVLEQAVAEQAAQNDTPGFELVALLSALGVALLVMRRRS